MYISVNNNHLQKSFFLNFEESNTKSYNIPQEEDKCEYDNCAICYEDLNIENTVMEICGLVRCGHIFHMDCLGDYFSLNEKRRYCPRCRCVTSKNNNVVILDEPISKLMKCKTIKEKRAILQTFYDQLQKITL